MGVGAGNDVRIRHDVAISDGKATTCDKAAAPKAGYLEHRLGGIVHAGRVDRVRAGNRKCRRQPWFEAREYGGKLDAGEDVPDTCEKGGALWRDGVQLTEHKRVLDLLSHLLARSAREAQA